MKAFRLHGKGGSVSLIVEEVRHPRPSEGELLIHVHAAGVTPSELSWYPTLHNKDGTERILPIPGHEFSGVVEATGEDVTDVAVGDEVYGLNDWFGDGAMAEYCLAMVRDVAPKPESLSHAEAACVPIAGLTAWQGLVERARLSTGQRVLIHGAAGGVGVFALQLARWSGAFTIATASAANAEFVRDLGANEVINYRAVPFEKAAQNIDVVFDTVGGDTLERSWSVLKPGGKVITIASSESTAEDSRVKDAFFIVEPNREQLRQLTSLIDEGHVRPVVDRVVPFESAAGALLGNADGKVHRGKVVVQIAS